MDLVFLLKYLIIKVFVSFDYVSYLILFNLISSIHLPFFLIENLFNIFIVYYNPCTLNISELLHFFYLKITICLTFLILIRGGLPRYRYDFLTKLGWIKFLFSTVTVFLVLLIFYLL